MRLRQGLNDRLISWKVSGGFKQTVVEILERGRRNGMVVIGFSIIATMIALALLAPVLPLADPKELNTDERLLPPSTRHWFGTDNLGQDVFSRVIWGTRVSLAVASLAVCFSLIIGV